jgi:hypothetical protein
MTRKMFETDGGRFSYGFAPRQKTRQPQRLVVPALLRPILHDWWERAGRPTTGPIFPALHGPRATKDPKVKVHKGKVTQTLIPSVPTSRNLPPRPLPGQQRGVRQDPLAKARGTPTSLRLAINAKCYDCGGQDSDPGWHDRIRHCAVPGCSLYPVRPFQRGDTDEQDGQ